MNRFYDSFACQFHKDALDPLLKSILEPPHIGAAAVRSASLPYGVAVVDRSRPQVSDQGEEAAPGDGADGAVADRRAQHQPPPRVDDGGEGPVLSEPAPPERP